MKKYKIKEEVKKYLPKEIHNDIYTFETWSKNTGLTIEALEEVEEKMDLQYYAKYGNYDYSKIIKSNKENFSGEELRLCEAILNASESTKEAVLKGGELYSKEDMIAFVDFSRRKHNVDVWSNALYKEYVEPKN